MAARGMLENPAMYSGVNTTPASCIADWIHIAMDIGTPFSTFHHHLIYMLEKTLSRYNLSMKGVLFVHAVGKQNIFINLLIFYISGVKENISTR